jgi:hypothetical protein
VHWPTLCQQTLVLMWQGQAFSDAPAALRIMMPT